MTIYFLQPENGGLIKIGYTAKANPAARIRELQTGSPHKLVLLAAEEGTEVDEKQLHAEFHELRVSGEWFRPDIRLLKRIVNGKEIAECRELKAYASSYMNCLWSHCSSAQTDDKATFNLLFLHAQYVFLNSGKCWEFVKERGVSRLCWKHLQYFFAMCWPVYKPWQELNSFIVQKLIEEGDIPASALFDPYAETRPLPTKSLQISCWG